MRWNRVARNICYAPAYTIMGGTTNILRNILAERVLGLPREPRPGLPDPADSSRYSRRRTEKSSTGSPTRIWTSATLADIGETTTGSAPTERTLS